MGDETLRARETLERAEHARLAGSRLARTAARAYFLRLAVHLAALVGVVGAANLWVPAGWPRTAVTAVATSGIVLLLIRSTQRSDVRVVPSRHAMVTVTLVGGAVVLGATFAADRVVGTVAAVAVSVVVTLVVWAAAAWWVGR